MLSEDNRPMGLYIHIPFCSSKCDYCDFVSYSMDCKAQQLYLDALFTEIDMVKDRYNDRSFNSIYIGGGTPSFVYEGFIASLARKIYSSFHILEGAEFTIEVNPSSFTKEKFFEYVQAGINRISVGVQCIDEDVLRSNGRIQSLSNIKETFKILQSAEFPNVNGDIMIGLPGQTERDVLDTVKFLIRHNVKHLSIYALQIERHTVLYNKLRAGKIKPIKDETMLTIYNSVYKLLKKEGYIRYEVSNFARPNFESRHNKKYWDDSQYLGLGVSAHSYIDGYRYYNTKRLDTYIDNMANGKTAVYSKEYISDEKRRTERIMLSLRTTEGLDLAKFKADFNEDLLRSRSEQIKKLIDLHMLELDGDILRITEDYYYVSNTIIMELL